VHNHPTVRPGGAETYAYELYEAMRSSDEFEPLFLARTGPPVSAIPRYHEGTLLTSVTNRDPNQYFFYTDVTNYDWMNGKSPTKEILTRFFTEFLEIHEPDVVHFQHTLFLGYDMLRATRNVLPDAPIVYTLHEFLPICHNNGQLIRTHEDELCLEASPRRCHECFPAISPQDFYLRERFIKSHLEEVDLFLAPSHFLRERYLDWGISPDRIRFEDYGRLQPELAVSADEEDRPRKNLGYFGQLSHFKGILVLLEAMRILAEGETDAHLWIHGANLDLQPDPFRREFMRLIAETEKNVTWIGPYEHHELPKLISEMDWVMVPSIWWENSPLVIQEAFLHNRPVICSDIGGMAEKVANGVDGLHFRARDPVNLARTIDRAVTTPGLWETLRDGIRDVFGMDEHVANLTQIYRDLLDLPREDLSLVSQGDGEK
jgi:glycosyltransferase involved in cell wall biosynthesis